MSDDLNYIEAIGVALDQAAHTNDAALDEYQVDLGTEYEEPKYILKLDNVGTFPRGDIQAIKAKSKNGKSFVCSILAASLFGCKDFGFESQEAEPSILYFDTEQNKRNTAKLARRVHALVGWDGKTNDVRFRAYSLRELDTDQRWPFILERVTARRPSMAIIDGIADLIDNFNDIDQSSTMIANLMRLSSSCDCCLTCVLHTNKAKDDSGMKGHLGTLLLQKASDVLEVKKNSDGAAFHVTETDCRNTPINDFSFCINRDGIPVTTETLKALKEQEKMNSDRDTIGAVLDKVYRNEAELGYNEFINAYQLQSGESEATAKRRLKRALELGMIEPSINGKYQRQGHRGQVTPIL